MNLCDSWLMRLIVDEKDKVHASNTGDCVVVAGRVPGHGTRIRDSFAAPCQVVAVQPLLEVQKSAPSGTSLARDHR